MKRTVALLALGMLAYAEPQVSPQRIIVNPVPTDLQVRVWVDRDPGKSGNPTYQNGEAISIGVQVNQDAYVYLLSIDAGGEINPILPNPFDEDNFLRGGETRRFPPTGARYTYTVSGPNGQNRVLAVASKRRLDMGRVLDVANDYQPRVQGEQLGRVMAIVVDPVPDRDWTSDVAFFVVGRAQPAPRAGTLVIDTDPQGAQVLLDGRSIGTTPMRIAVNPGRYRLEFVLDGYERSGLTLSVDPGETVHVERELKPIASVLEFYSNVETIVYVDGREAGRTKKGYLRLRLSPGEHQVVALAPGYEAFVANVRLRGNQTLQANLNRL
ncbi:DUF4384 domain-containing protein [Calidithermus roseus]|uniref:PEGA domain protein n=1 Tax=Calidithermus roseus TaxID=1644118 RepID=A0A399EDN0_9DEIN|nr:DUF4384 domain-containing protein [Calidithermus roseus]RIH82737.1 hypothetical protein Mrose_03285 [Calidithermus roseus]